MGGEDRIVGKIGEYGECVVQERERERESGSGVTAAISRARGRYCTEREWRSVRGDHGSVAGSRRIGK